MKHLLLLWVFIVSWNEYAIKDNCVKACDMGQCWHIKPCTQIFTVELTTKTIKLATQADVDLYIGKEVNYIETSGTIHEPKLNKWVTRRESLVGDKAFNIQVKEEK